MQNLFTDDIRERGFRPGWEAASYVLKEALVNSNPRRLTLDWDDAAYLYMTVRAARPQLVLEFGSGFSTLVISLALKHNGAGFLFSCESDEGWAIDNRAWLMHHGDSSMFHIASCPTTTTSRPNPKKILDICEGISYLRVPKIHPDLVYLDGPELKDGYNITFNLEDYAKYNNIFVIDGRHDSVAYYESLLIDNPEGHWPKRRMIKNPRGKDIVSFG